MILYFVDEKKPQNFAHTKKKIVKLIIWCQDIFAWSHSLIWNVVVSFYCYQELDKLRTENKDMRTDMLKMAKQHQKLQHKLKDLVEFEKTKKLLEAMAFYVCTCHYCSNVLISWRTVHGWSNIPFQKLRENQISFFYNFTCLLIPEDAWCIYNSF